MSVAEEVLFLTNSFTRFPDISCHLLDMNSSWIPVVIVVLILVFLAGFGCPFYYLLKISTARRIDAERAMIAVEGFSLKPMVYSTAGYTKIQLHQPSSSRTRLAIHGTLFDRPPSYDPLPVPGESSPVEKILSPLLSPFQGTPLTAEEKIIEGLRSVSQGSDSLSVISVVSKREPSGGIDPQTGRLRIGFPPGPGETYIIIPYPDRYKHEGKPIRHIFDIEPHPQCPKKTEKDMRIDFNPRGPSPSAAAVSEPSRLPIQKEVLSRRPPVSIPQVTIQPHESVAGPLTKKDTFSPLNLSPRKKTPSASTSRVRTSNYYSSHTVSQSLLPRTEELFMETVAEGPPKAPPRHRSKEREPETVSVGKDPCRFCDSYSCDESNCSHFDKTCDCPSGAYSKHSRSEEPEPPAE